MVALALLGAFVAGAQESEPSDSLVRLMKASSVQVAKEGEVTFRKSFDATFLHNGTYLICDTAVWNDQTNIISAVGNVKLIQGDAILTSRTLEYDVDASVARFRGDLVQLKDKEDNTLRTNNLDYYTKDSLAKYVQGAAMKDHDGQIIESSNGTYSNSEKVFHFSGNVNMFTDSVFIRTNVLSYDTNTDIAYFERPTDFWKEKNMLSAEGGWYDRKEDLFFLENKVHAMSEEQELWSDSLYYYRASGNLMLLGNVQLRDTVNNISALADYLFYEDSLSRMTMERDPAVRMITRQEETTDTLYLCADKFIYNTIRHCDIDTLVIADSRTRLEGVSIDPILNYRNNAALEAKKKADEQKKQLEEGKTGNSRFRKPGLPSAGNVDSATEKSTAETGDEDVAEGMQTEGAAGDTVAVGDTLAAVMAPQPEEPVDTSEVGFLTALKNIRLFRSDLQMCCDSIYYCDLDSIARIFGEPIIWNDGNRQYTADSIDIQILESRPYKADLISGAFIIVEEMKDLYYDQIKGSEIIAYFDTTSTLKRFDAIGGASAIFFLKEDDAFATVNTVESKMITADFVDGEISGVTYFDKPKNNVFPVVQLPEKDKKLTGFDYRPQLRPSGKEDITTKEFRESERKSYRNHPNTKFSSTDKYFPGYIKGIKEEIAERARQRELDKPLAEGSEAEVLVAGDTVAVDRTDSVSVDIPDSASVRTEPERQVVEAPADSGSVAAPGVAVEAVKSAKLERQQARAAKQALRTQKRDAAWEKKKAKAEAREERKRLAKELRQAKRDAKAASLVEKQEERDLQKFERYKKRYEKKLLGEQSDDVEDDL